MKTRKIIFILFLPFMLTSCFWADPHYEDSFYVKNMSGQSVTCKLEHNRIYTGDVMVEKNEKEYLFAVHALPTSSCFDNGSQYIFSVDFKFVFIFEDSTTICYDKNSPFSKNPCLTNNWEIFDKVDKKKNKQYKALYTITEEDYQNAISQE